MEYRGYLIENDGVYGHKAIKYNGRGGLHTELRGVFTTYSIAQRAIDNVLALKEENANAKGNISV